MRLMFGKKKEEEWEYIEQYFQKDNYGQVADDEYWQRENIKTDDLIEIFKPYLLDGEQILCVIGGGKGKTKNFFESGKNQRKFIIYRCITIIALIFIFSLFFLVLFSDNNALFFKLLKIFMFGVPAAAFITSIVFVIKGACSGVKGLNYAITDKRIISDGFGELTYLSLGDITSTSASVSSGSKGKLTVRANKYKGQTVLYILVIPDVNEPYRVKNILDKAIADYKKNRVL